MFAVSVGGILALMALLVCASRGFVLRGLVAGALVGSLGVAEFVFELTAIHGNETGRPGAAMLAMVVAIGCVLLQLVVTAVAVSKQRAGAPTRSARRRRA